MESSWPMRRLRGELCFLLWMYHQRLRCGVDWSVDILVYRTKAFEFIETKDGASIEKKVWKEILGLAEEAAPGSMEAAGLPSRETTKAYGNI